MAVNTIPTRRASAPSTPAISGSRVGNPSGCKRTVSGASLARRLKTSIDDASMAVSWFARKRLRSASRNCNTRRTSPSVTGAPSANKRCATSQARSCSELVSSMCARRPWPYWVFTSACTTASDPGAVLLCSSCRVVILLLLLEGYHQYTIYDGEFSREKEVKNYCQTILTGDFPRGILVQRRGRYQKEGL